MSEALVLIACLIVFGGVWVIRKNERKREDLAWRAAADELGGKFSPARGPWYRARTARIKLKRDGRKVVLDHYAVDVADAIMAFTRARAKAPAMGPLTVSVMPSTFLSNAARHVGFAPLDTGDAQFDDNFLVSTNDAGFARAWLSADVRRAIAELGTCRIDLADGSISITQPRFEIAPGKLDAMARAAARIAGQGRAIRQIWTEFAHKELGANHVETAPARFAIDVDDGPIPLRIDTGTSAGGPTHTRIVARIVGARTEPFTLSRDERAEAELMAEQDAEQASALSAYTSPDRPRFAPEIEQRIAELKPLRLTRDGDSVTMILPDVEASAARLREACHVVETLAGAGPRRYG